MALALNNGYPDVHTIMYDIKDLLRTSLQVNKAQNAEIHRLGGKPLNDLMAAEYEERVHAALGQVDAALDAFESQSYEAASSDYEFDVMAWIRDTNSALGLDFSSPVNAAADVVSNSDAVSINNVPIDFWTVHDSFKWEDEPLSDDGSASHSDFDIARPVSPSRPVFETTTTFAPRLVPEEQISEIFLDDDEDSDQSFSTPRDSNSNSNFDDGATLYHPEDASSPIYLTHRRRHTLIADKLAALEPLPAHKLHSFAAIPAAASHSTTTPHPTRTYGLARRSSAPDLRALRGPHDILLEEDEHMLVSAF